MRDFPLPITNFPGTTVFIRGRRYWENPTGLEVGHSPSLPWNLDADGSPFLETIKAVGVLLAIMALYAMVLAL